MDWKNSRKPKKTFKYIMRFFGYYILKGIAIVMALLLGFILFCNIFMFVASALN